MTRLEDRQNLVRDIEQACADGSRLVPACALAGIDARTLRRWQPGDGGSRKRHMDQGRIRTADTLPVRVINQGAV
jgi:hypothetical protein